MTSSPALSSSSHIPQCVDEDNAALPVAILAEKMPATVYATNTPNSTVASTNIEVVSDAGSLAPPCWAEWKKFNTVLRLLSERPRISAGPSCVECCCLSKSTEGCNKEPLAFVEVARSLNTSVDPWEGGAELTALPLPSWDSVPHWSLDRSMALAVGAASS